MSVSLSFEKRSLNLLFFFSKGRRRVGQNTSRQRSDYPPSQRRRRRNSRRARQVSQRPTGKGAAAARVVTSLKPMGANCTSFSIPTFASRARLPRSTAFLSWKTGTTTSRRSSMRPSTISKSWASKSVTSDGSWRSPRPACAKRGRSGSRRRRGGWPI